MNERKGRVWVCVTEALFLGLAVRCSLWILWGALDSEFASWRTNLPYEPISQERRQGARFSRKSLGGVGRYQRSFLEDTEVLRSALEMHFLVYEMDRLSPYGPGWRDTLCGRALCEPSIERERERELKSVACQRTDGEWVGCFDSSLTSSGLALLWHTDLSQHQETCCNPEVRQRCCLPRVDFHEIRNWTAKIILASTWTITPPLGLPCIPEEPCVDRDGNDNEVPVQGAPVQENSEILTEDVTPLMQHDGVNATDTLLEIEKRRRRSAKRLTASDEMDVELSASAGPCHVVASVSHLLGWYGHSL